MRQKVKTLSAVLSFFIIAIMMMVAYGNVTISAEYIVPENTVLDLGCFFKMSDVKRGSNVASYAKAKSVGAVSSKAKDNQKAVDVKLFGVVPVKTATLTKGQRKYVVPSGDVFGLRIYSDGLMVIAIDNVETDMGKISPAEAAGLKNGDLIKAVNKTPVEKTSDFTKAVEKSEGQSLQLQVVRGEETMALSLTPALASFDGKYKAGLWLRDSTAGIGTMTFYDPASGIFGGLGHAVCDADTTKIVPLGGGDALTAIIKGCYKGSNGTAGELCGVFGDKVIGSLAHNGTSGVYGLLSEYDKKAKALPVAMRQEVQTGPAQIISTVDNEGPQIYDIEILKINTAADANERNMTIEIKDDDLISKTGGIVQGMSGSPIIQNGYLVGAVTHVFINNSLQGYGIFAENMMKTSDSLLEMMKNNNAA
ncbi:MAG: SpoIVB peptidase [Oscillospiraceae bacterium]|nr:SpoIVB peptidase [Oscillospiraceae bacterium]